MTIQFTVSPDFPADRISGWYIFNTWMQRTLGTGIHLEIYNDFGAQRKAIAEGRVDLIYANPYDAAMLVREKGFVGVARPRGRSDEVVVAVSAAGQVIEVEALRPGTRVVSTDDPDIEMMGMILLEPADLNRQNVERKVCSSYVLVAKALMNGEADVGLFLADAYAKFSPLIRDSLRPLVTSQIHVVKHLLLLGPAASQHLDPLRNGLLAMADDAKGKSMLDGLGLDVWEAVDREDVEFMIDLIDTLVE